MQANTCISWPHVFNQPVWRNLMVDILHRVGIKAPLTEVYKAVATREGVAGWWTERTTGESKVGGALQFRFTSGDTDIGGFEMKVLALEPERHVGWQVVNG